MQNIHRIQIKGMVCSRCISTVQDSLSGIGVHPMDITLGEVTVSVTTTIPDLSTIEEKLKPLGFTLLEDKKTKLVRQVKRLVEEVYSGEYDFPSSFRFSQLVAAKFNKDYDTASSVFSAAEQITLEQYIINFRIEKVKEFLIYSSETQFDISLRLGFSSVAHLSRQFKAVTGFNPSYFKSLKRDKELNKKLRGLS